MASSSSPSQALPLIVCISGPPAAGKGTQCERIVARYGLAHLSTGDILRDHVQRQTALGSQAKRYMDQGLLVPDELITDLVLAKLREGQPGSPGYLLDGFPRSAAQARQLISEARVPIQKFICIDVPDEVLVERGVGRRLDPETGKIYHLKFDPPPEHVRGRLVHRSDDQEDKIRTRLQQYHSQVQGVLGNLQSADLCSVDGTKKPDGVFQEISTFLEASGGLWAPLEVAPEPEPLPAKVTSPPEKVVCIAGPPAAGKGTQCEKIVAQFGLVHLSTGDILRDHVKRGTALGKKAKEYMDQGLLVPDDLITNLVITRMQESDVMSRGCLLDGFPRSAKQTTSLVEAGINIHKFIRIDVPDESLIERGVGRRLDPETGKIYHLKFDPPPASVQHRLVHRSDDHEDKIRRRLQQYHEQVQGVMGALDKADVFIVDGALSPAQIFGNISFFLTAPGGAWPALV